MGRVELSAELVPLLDDPEAEVRMEAIRAQGLIGNAQAAKELVQRLVERDGAEREELVLALSQMDKTTIAAQFDALAELSGNQRDSVRAAAVRVLGGISDARIVDYLSFALEDRSADVRLHAVRGLTPLATSRHTDALGVCLTDSYGDIRIAAATALGCVGGERAVEHLTKALVEDDERQREAVCSALAAIGFDSIGPALDLLLAGEGESARLGAIWTLGKCAHSDSRAVRMLGLLFREPSAKLRASVAGALGKVQTAEAANALLAGLADPDEHVRAASVNALAKVGTSDHLAHLVPVLADPDRFVKERAMLAIAWIGGQSAYEHVRAIPDLERLDQSVVAVSFGLCGSPEALAKAIALVRSPEITAAVQKRLSSESADLRIRFLKDIRLGVLQNSHVDRSGVGLIALEKLEPLYLESLRNSQDLDVRRRAAGALSSMAGPLPVKALAEALLHDPDSDVRLRAIQGLSSRTEDEVARSAILRAMSDPEPTVRILAIRATGRVGSLEDSFLVLECLRTSNADVMTAAVETIARMFADRIETFHDWMMSQPSDVLRVAALAVLRAMADVRSVGLLKHFLYSENPSLRLGAARALAVIHTPDAYESMFGALSDPLEALRVDVVHALRDAPQKDVAERLSIALTDPSVTVRRSLADTLAALDHNAAVGGLVKLCADSDSGVACTAFLGILAHAHEEAQSQALTLWENLHERAQILVREQCVVHVGSLTKQATNALALETRSGAFQLMAQLDLQKFAPHIAIGLLDPEPEIRMLAVRLLSSLGSAEAATWLGQAQSDPEKKVRTAAQRAITKLGGSGGAST
jgi:HEAT repeat protein